LKDIEELVSRHPGIPPPEVLERAFQDHVASAEPHKFNGTLFRYLLPRLGRVGSRTAVTFCLEAIQNRPEETGAILSYFSKIPLTEREIDVVLQYAASPGGIYDYQLYQIVKWFYEEASFSPMLVELCRKLAFDRNRDPWLRTYSLAVLGAAGNTSDLETIENSYSSATSEIEKADIVTAVERLELSRRNGLYTRVKQDGELVQRAINAIRNKRRRT
jgi:hypothetical protein